MSRATTALGLVLAGCLAVTKATVSSKALWLGVGLPAVAVGLWAADLRFSPVAGLRAVAEWLNERASDLEIVAGIAREVPEQFRLRKGRNT